MKLLCPSTQVLLPQIEPLTDQQHQDVGNLQHSSQQAEDALSQGIDKLQQSLSHAMASDPMSGDNFGTHLTAAVEKLDELESFVSQVNEQLSLFKLLGKNFLHPKTFSMKKIVIARCIKIFWSMV